MKLRFTPRAIENLADIGNYLGDRSPAAAHRVRAAIYEALQNLLLFPSAGRLQKVGHIRKFVTPRFAYLIYYLHDEAAAEIVILNIKHPARDREHQDR